jgi:hypothetical protein
LRCAECVGEAMMKSEARTLTMARQELSGLDLSMVWPLLWLIAKDVGIYIGGGVVLGGIVGGVIGAFFGGAGAIPGAIGGGAVVTTFTLELRRRLVCPVAKDIGFTRWEESFHGEVR